MGSRRMPTTLEQDERYRATYKAKANSKREQGLCTYMYCESPLSPRSKHYSEELLKERTDRQRERRARLKEQVAAGR
jgi:hypothetical protein